MTLYALPRMIRRGLALCLLALVLSPCTAPFQTWRMERALGASVLEATQALLLPSAIPVGESSVAPPPRVRTTALDAPAVLNVAALGVESVADTPGAGAVRHDADDPLAPDGAYFPRLTVLRV